MARLPGFAEQTVLTFGYRADGVNASATVPQLILPQSTPRSTLWFANSSDTQMYFEMGGARAHAAITSGAVSSITIDNAGFNYTYAPKVWFLGGGANQNGLFLGVPGPSQISPSKPAQGTAVLTTDGYGGGKFKIASITIDDPGAGYACAPYIFLENSPNDAYGCADPAAGGGSGLLLYPGQGVPGSGDNITPTDALAVFCGVISKPFFCRYTT